MIVGRIKEGKFECCSCFTYEAVYAAVEYLGTPVIVLTTVEDMQAFCEEEDIGYTYTHSLELLTTKLGDGFE